MRYNGAVALLLAVAWPTIALSQQSTSDDVIRQVVIEKWAKSYMRCAVKISREIDNRISDAQIVAIDLQNRCQNLEQLTGIMSVADATDLASSLKPNLVEMVLRQRAAAKKAKPF